MQFQNRQCQCQRVDKPMAERSWLGVLLTGEREAHEYVAVICWGKARFVVYSGSNDLMEAPVPCVFISNLWKTLLHFPGKVGDLESIIYVIYHSVFYAGL